MRVVKRSRSSFFSRVMLPKKSTICSEPSMRRSCDLAGAVFPGSWRGARWQRQVHFEEKVLGDSGDQQRVIWGWIHVTCGPAFPSGHKLQLKIIFIMDDYYSYILAVF